MSFDVPSQNKLSIIAMAMTVLLQTCIVSSLVSPYPNPAAAFISNRNCHRPTSVPYRSTSWALLMAQEVGDGEPSAATATKAPSKRAQRKAAERAKKQRQQKQANSNKATSQHPEAIIKRERQRQPPQPRKNSRRKHNFAERSEFLQESENQNDEFNSDLDGMRDNRLTNTGYENVSNTGNDGTVVHPLHSTAVDKLDVSTTAEEVVKAIKRAQNLHDVHDIREIAHFLLEEVDMSFAYGYRGSLLSRLAVASLHMNNHDIAERCITERRISHRSSMLPLESAAIVRGLLRCHHVKEAWEVLEDELSLPLDGWVEFDASQFNDELHLEEEAVRQQLEIRDKLIHRARSIGSIASRHFYEEEPTAGMAAISKLKDMGEIVKESGLTAEDLGMPWERFVRGAAMCESKRRDGKWDGDDSDEDPSSWPCNIVYTVLDAMIAYPPENKDVTFEALCNALVRRTVFVTGAVNMDGCPEADRGEVAFIGRSNVGKSSLVNMLTNRKSLAFTSKTPGKTQQFNYFAVNDKPELARQIRYGDEVGGSKDGDSFYIVDLPGFGFAKVTQQLRQEWSDFMEEYIEQRETLRVIFHLIDARHGPTDEDGKIMQKVGSILGSDRQRNHAKYVIILTKADKNVKGANSQKNPGKVSQSVRERLVNTMNANGVGYAPIVLTSAETRLGRDEVWKYLRLAAEQ
jgi:GTP-binding protein EngB required for normal cell division